jgi:hypothetical protein
MPLSWSEIRGLAVDAAYVKRGLASDAERVTLRFAL